MYLGKSRTRAWFEAAYQEYSHTIAYVGGAYLHVADAINRHAEITPTSPTLGSIGVAPRDSEVLSVIDGTSVLVITRPWSPVYKSVWRLGGIDTSSLIDHSPITTGTIVCVGTYQYASAGNSERTVTSYEVLKPISREQFSNALAKGFILPEPKRLLIPRSEIQVRRVGDTFKCGKVEYRILVASRTASGPYAKVRVNMQVRATGLGATQAIPPRILASDDTFVSTKTTRCAPEKILSSPISTGTNPTLVMESTLPVSDMYALLFGRDEEQIIVDLPPPPSGVFLPDKENTAGPTLEKR